MGLISSLKQLLLPPKKSTEIQIVDVSEEMDELELAEEVKKVQTFESKNTISNKLNYLEQYIKIFSLTFPDDYSRYLNAIIKIREAYTKELDEFQKGKNGYITFSIDPEHESDFYVEVLLLEEEIKKFVEFEVDFKFCKDKFSKLCYKLNIFYNTIIDTSFEQEKIVSQVNNAYNSLEMLVKDLDERAFFEKDSRKKDDILNYIMYCDYIIFKTFLRMGIVSTFAEYKNQISKIYSYFPAEQYDSHTFRFFIESVEEIQIFITEKLTSDKMFEYVLKESQNVERKLDGFQQSFNDNEFLQAVIKLENTVYGLVKLNKLSFTFDTSKTIDFNVSKNEVISINNIAASILPLVGNDKSKLLAKIMSRFKVEISWREFFFLCKIFELTQDIVSTSSNTVFSMIQEKFLKLEERYSEYTDEYIASEKQHVLKYVGSKVKKYVLLLNISKKEIVDIVETLTALSLDFVIRDDKVYLNHSYFNGFKNLEENFGQEIVF